MWLLALFITSRPQNRVTGCAEARKIAHPASDGFFISSQWQRRGWGEGKQALLCTFGGRKSDASWGTIPVKLCWALGSWQGFGSQRRHRGGSYEDHLATAGVRTEPQGSAAFRAADSVLQEAHVGRAGGPERGGGRCTCGGAGGAHSLRGDSQDEGAGFLEPTEGLEKPTGVVTLPGQSFDGLDDLVMQIAGWGGGVQ